ncbi:MAG: hypothetical protein M1820_008966 [Bogoriella megaspora]|nr:MAG: hypothetical protein M1820_008966 [Bogoriella megaspora]
MTRRTTRAAAANGGAAASNPVKQEPQQLSSPPATPVPLKGKGVTRKASKAQSNHITPHTRETRAEPPTPASSKKRTRAAVKQEDINELPHNLGASNALLNAPEDTRVNEALPKKKSRTTTRKPSKRVASNDLDEKPSIDAADTTVQVHSDSTKKAKKPKNINYGLTPGSTPFPDWPHPTPEECHEVVSLLSKIHGKIEAPKTIPLPSLQTSGCGEVPSVLDALIRTRLSAATSGTNSSRAFQGLVQKFGIIQEGIGKGSVDWDKVRRADTKEVFEAIKSGGLADVKSRDIKNILQMVYEENQSRRSALLESKTKGESAGPSGVENESHSEKTDEIERANSNVLSLDHLHLLSNDDAFDHLIKYPGIGPKTASCVLLFCLQRPSFAVDTHVFRLCKWLRWVPPDKATRNSTYAHCEVRVPDELKYPLHQLLIRHGKSCPRCRAATGQGSEGWKKGCPIEKLVTRGGWKKGGAGGAGGKKKKKGSEHSEGSESEVGSSGLSDMGDEDEDEVTGKGIEEDSDADEDEE